MGDTKRKAPAIVTTQQATRYAHYQSYGFVAAPASAVIAYRTRQLSELDDPVKLVTGSYGRVMPFAVAVAAANPIIPFRQRLHPNFPIPQLPPQSAYSTGVYNQFSTPVIEYRIGQITESSPTALVRPQYARLVPYGFTVATGINTIAFRYGRSITMQPDPLVQAQRGAVPAAQPYAVPATRIGQPSNPEAVALVRPQVFQFPYFEQPANPGVPFRYGRPSSLAPEQSGRAAYFSFPFLAAQAASTSNLIPFRYGRGRLDLDSSLVYPSSIRAVPPAPQPYPIIPISIGQAISRDPAPWVGSQFTRFPFFAFTPAAASPVIGFRIGTLAAFAPVPGVQLTRSSAPFFAGSVAAANPIIPIRSTRNTPDAQSAASYQARYQPFPWTVGIAQPLPIRIAAQAFSLPYRLPSSGYQAFPWPAQVAALTPVIGLRTGSLAWLRQEPATLPASFFFPLTQGAEAYPAIPFRQGPRSQPDSLFIQTAGYRPTPAWVAPANAVIAYRRGQWLSDQVQPLVGIHGYMAYPWFSTIPAVGEPYRTIPGREREGSFDARTRRFTFQARGREYVQDMNK